MACIWQYRKDGIDYKVTSAGSSVRLYTNGVFHSQYSPKHLFTGAMWDALSIPALFGEDYIKTVLALGIGGGTVIHQLLNIARPKAIVGVEINSVHLKVATEYFKLNHENLTLVNADAVQHLRRHKRQYDLIVDDIFLEGKKLPYRPVRHEDKWINLLHSRLTGKGVLVQNYLCNRDATLALAANEEFLKKHFSSALQINVPRYENGVMAFFRRPLSIRDARNRLKERLNASFSSRDLKKLCYQMKTVF